MAKSHHPPATAKKLNLRKVQFKNNRPNSITKEPSPAKCLPVNRRSSVGRMTRSSTDLKPPENYENLLLFYLNKLKSLFSNNHPRPQARENSAVKMNKLHHGHYLRNTPRTRSEVHPCRYSSSNPPRPREEDVQAKVYRVVSAALEYGCANNVLEKQGDFYVLRNLRPRLTRLATRQSTPGPRYCERCLHSYGKDGPKEVYSEGNKMSWCDRHLHSIEQGKIGREYRRKSDSIMCVSNHRLYDERQRTPSGKPAMLNIDRKPNSLRGNVLHCPDCKAFEQRGRK